MAVLQKEASSKLTASIVIPTFGRPALALSLAQQIRGINSSIQIIIVDQEKTSKISEKEIKKLNIDLVNLPSPNTSVAKNEGIKHARGDIVVFFDDDVEIKENTIDNHLKIYEDPGISGVSGRVINDNETIPSYTDVNTGETNILGTKFLWQYWSTKKQFVDFAYGCNMSYRKKILEEIGGFDKNFPKIFEEIDLGVRITRKGYKILFSPEVFIYHHKAPSGGTRTNLKDKMKMIYSHYGYYLAKNVPFPLSILSLLLRTKSAVIEAPWAIIDLYKGYFRKFI